MTSAQVAPTHPPYKNRRGWLIAFGVVEILIACAILLMLAIMVFGILAMRHTNAQQFGPISPTAVMALAGLFYGAHAALFFAVGVGSIRCKNWARITMLSFSALWLGIGVLATLMVLLIMPTIMQQGTIPSQTRHLVEAVMIAFTVIVMVVLPAVFLFFYSRKSVKATCLSQAVGQSAPPSVAGPVAPKVPAPVYILASWELLGVFSVLGIWVGKVAIVFGVVLHGPAAILLLLAHSLLSGYATWAIYRRKVVGWAIALFKNLFWMTSFALTFLGHNMLQVYREMGLSEQQLQVYQQFPQLLPVIHILSLLMLVAYLVFIFYAKKFFSNVEEGSETGTAV